MHPYTHACMDAPPLPRQRFTESFSEMPEAKRQRGKEAMVQIIIGSVAQSNSDPGSSDVENRSVLRRHPIGEGSSRLPGTKLQFGQPKIRKKIFGKISGFCRIIE
jgi:hypothetical protein